MMFCLTASLIYQKNIALYPRLGSCCTYYDEEELKSQRKIPWQISQKIVKKMQWKTFAHRTNKFSWKLNISCWIEQVLSKTTPRKIVKIFSYVIFFIGYIFKRKSWELSCFFTSQMCLFIACGNGFWLRNICTGFFTRKNKLI